MKFILLFSKLHLIHNNFAKVIVLANKRCIFLFFLYFCHQKSYLN